MRKARNMSQIFGILFSRINARSNKALTLAYSAEWIAGFLFRKCLTRISRYCKSISLHSQDLVDELVLPSSIICTTGVDACRRAP